MEMLIGVAVSLFIQYVKNVLKLGEYATLGAVLVLSIAAAGIYTVLVNTGLWTSLVPILTTAGAFYTYVIARFEKPAVQ